MNEPEVGTERSDKQAVLAVPTLNSLQSKASDYSKKESERRESRAPLEKFPVRRKDLKSLDAPSLTSANSFKSQRSGHVSK